MFYLIKRHYVLIVLFIPFSLYSQNLDIRILRSINSPETLSSDRFFQFASNSDMYVVLGVPAGMGTIALFKHDDELLRNTCEVLTAQAVNAGITFALKYSIKRERPFITYSDIEKKSDTGGPAFPSGHTSSAFAVATSLSLTYPKWYVIVPSYTWAGTVGYSRMHLGVHYPSDVLVGALVGAGSAWVSHLVNKKLENSVKRQLR